MQSASAGLQNWTEYWTRAVFRKVSPFEDDEKERIIGSWPVNTLRLPEFDIYEALKATPHELEWKPYKFSLKNRHLENADLRSARFDSVDLREANLTGARLDKAKLDKSDLTDAALCGASLEYARLQGASLDKAYLRGASLKHAQLQGASLTRTHLTGAWLDEA
jgi:hypothetical protein